MLDTQHSNTVLTLSLLHQLLEDNWQMIRDEALSQLNTKTASFQPEAESLLDKGDWKQLTLYQQGQRIFFPSGTSSVLDSCTMTHWP